MFRVAVTGPLQVLSRARERVRSAGGELTDAASADVCVELDAHATAPAGEVLTVRAASWGAACDGSAVIALDAPAEVFKRQLLGWARIANAERELKVRHETLRCLGLEAPRQPNLAPIQVLYVGAPHASFLAIAAELRRQGISIDAALSANTGLDHLHDRDYDALILCAAEDPTGTLAMCAALRRNASLIHVPTTVLTDDLSLSAQALARGAEGVSTTRAACGPPLSWLLAAALRERRARAAQRHLFSIHNRLGHPRTGLWRADAFTTHLGQLVSHHCGRPLAIAAFSVLTAPGARQPIASDWQRALTEAANLTAQMLRDIDSGAMIADDTLVLAMPGLAIDAAKQAAARIAAVIECSAFASAGPLVLEQAVVDLRPGESAEALFARAMSASARVANA